MDYYDKLSNAMFKWLSGRKKTIEFLEMIVVARNIEAHRKIFKYTKKLNNWKYWDEKITSFAQHFLVREKILLECEFQRQTKPKKYSIGPLDSLVTRQIRLHKKVYKCQIKLNSYNKVQTHTNTKNS